MPPGGTQSRDQHAELVDRRDQRLSANVSKVPIGDINGLPK
jgi:hypothetical protein